MRTYIFFYFMNEKMESIKMNAPKHANYWKNRLIKGGPFHDFSGGFIVFNADNEQNAKELMEGDPFVTEELLAQMWLKEWLEK